MEFTQLGRTGLKVSRFCLGTMNFGPLTSEEDAFVIMDKAHELGINFFDTANVYGWKIGEGVTENIVGRWFAQGGGRREKTVIATKVFGRMGDWPNQSQLSALHIRAACEASLKRLHTDHIDLYQMHHVDRNTPWDEIWQAMEVLWDKARCFMSARRTLQAGILPKRRKLPKRVTSWDSSANRVSYSLNDRMIELEVIPACKDYGLGLIPYSPLSGGLLGGALQKIKEGRRARPEQQKEIKAKRTKLEAWEKILQSQGRASRRCGVGMAVEKSSGDRADHRPAHDGSIDRRVACLQDQVLEG